MLSRRIHGLAAGLALALASAPTRGAELQPALFGEGVFTTGAYDFFVALTPDQKTAYFCRASADFGYWTILETHRVGDRWSPPAMAPFSGRWSDADPHVSPDGSKLFFISNRPDSGNVAKPSCDLWVVARSGSGWGTPRPVGPGVCTEATEWSPSVAANGNLYFGATREGGKGRDDIWMSRFENGRYSSPVNLGDSINTKLGEVEPWIAPDESYLVFSAGGRPEGKGGPSASAATGSGRARVRSVTASTPNPGISIRASPRTGEPSTSRAPAAGWRNPRNAPWTTSSSRGCSGDLAMGWATSTPSRSGPWSFLADPNLPARGPVQSPTSIYDDCR